MEAGEAHNNIHQMGCPLLIEWRIKTIWSQQMHKKAFDRVQHPFVIKKLNKLSIEGTYCNIIKTVWQDSDSISFQLLLFSCPVVSDSLWPHGLQHASSLYPSPSPRVCPSSCPLRQWCHPPISSSKALFSFCPPSFPASGASPMSQLFTSDDQNIGASALASVLPVNIQGWFPLRLIGLILLINIQN